MRNLSIESLESKRMLAAGGHVSTLDLETGSWENQGFVAKEVIAGEEFSFDGCGFENAAAYGQGGDSFITDNKGDVIQDTKTWDSTFVPEGDPDYGCIAQGGTSRYEPIDKPGWYNVTFFTWDVAGDVVVEGNHWFKVSKK